MSKLRETGEDLYQNPKEPTRIRRTKLTRRSSATRGDWERADISKKVSNNKIPYFKLLITAIVFFFLSILISALITFFGLDNKISSDKISVDIQSPLSIDSGEVSEISIVITNRNPVSTVLTDLIINYPKGARDSKTDNVLIRTRESLGPIPVNGSVRHTVSPRLFGKTGENKEIEVFIEYRLQDSQALFSTDKKQTVLVRSSPVTLTIDGIENAISGRETEYLLTVISNTTEPIDEILIKKEYPVRFLQLETSEQEIEDETGWSIRNLRPKERRQIRIRGVFIGADGDKQSLSFEGYINTDAQIASISKLVTIESPPIAVVMRLNGSRTNVLNIDGGQNIEGELRWENESREDFANMEVSITFSGNGLDKSRIIVSDGGGYDINENKIVWNSNTTRSLRVIDPGENDTFEFRFKSLASDPLLDLENKEIVLTTNVSFAGAERQSRIQNIKNISVKTLRVRSDVVLLGSTKHRSSKLPNTGPIPPKVGEETTYSLSLILKNNGNRLENVSVVIPLEDYVEWLGGLIPSAANVTYDDRSKEVSWDVGSLTGIGQGSSKEIQFRVALVPRLSDVGKNLSLTDIVELSYFDTFTEQTINIKTPEFDIRLKGESTDRKEGEVVR